MAINQLIYQRAEAAGRAVRLAPKPDYLAGREGLLAEVHTRLSAGDASTPRTVVLSGMGGAGKTSVALEYAHCHQGEVGVAWQFDCEDLAVLPDEFGILADQLNVRDLLATRDWVATVHGVLAEYPRGWLLIFDNVEDPAAVRKFLPPAGPGRVLVTSRNPLWSPGQAVDVPVLSTDVAADFLISRTGDPDKQAAAGLAGELGGLPLALEQAGAYMQATRVTLAEYLELFRQRRADMLVRGEPIGYDRTVATTWDLAFGRLQQASPRAVGLLRLLAFCAPEAIPLRLLLQPRPGLVEQLGQDVAPLLTPLLADWVTAIDAIADLHRYSLVTAKGGVVSVHRLVQAVTIGQMSAGLAGQWRQAVAALIEAALPEDARQPQTWPVFGRLRPHADKVLAPGSSGMERVASYLGNSGSYAAARDLQRGVVRALEQMLSPEHPDTLTARRDLARWTGRAGDRAEARAQSEALLPVTERVLGSEHPDTLAVRAEIANWTRKGGGRGGHRRKHSDTGAVRADGPSRTREPGGRERAAAQYAELLPVFRRVLGPEHLDTLAVRKGLAWSTGEAKKTVEARDQFADLLPVVGQVLGPEHPITLDARAGLARFTGSEGGVGDPAGARDQFTALLPEYQRILGPEHPETLYIRHSVARWTGQAGNPAGARDQYEALLSARERILGPEHPDTRDARKLLAYWTEKANSQAN